MGAANVVDAFRRWAGSVPGTSMLLLTYMAVVSKDKDEWPWFGMGQEALAQFALGRKNPGRADVRAVSRAMQPLLDIGAVTVDRASAARADGNTTARYRLNIHDRADQANRNWAETYDGNRRTSNPPEDPQRTTESGHDVRRKVTQRTTKSGTTYDGNRRTKEEEDQEEREDRGIGVEVATTSHPSRATSEPTSNPDSSPRPSKCEHGLPSGSRADGLAACALCRVKAGTRRPPPGELAPVIQLRPREAS